MIIIRKMLGLPFIPAFFGGTRLGMYCTFVHQALRCYVDQGMRRLTYEILGALTLGKISAICKVERVLFLVNAFNLKATIQSQCNLSLH